MSVMAQYGGTYDEDADLSAVTVFRVTVTAISGKKKTTER